MSELDKTERRIEAMLFASGDPLEKRKIAEILDIEENTVHGIVENIRERYKKQDSPVDIRLLEGAYQMSTYAEYAPYIQSALEVRRSATLSQAALEALAVIAYNQPVTRAFVEEVRGVDCSSLIRNLVEKDLIEEAGRMNVPGKPIIYKTTATFLRSFNLESIEHLPTLPEVPTDDPDLELQVEGQIDFDSNVHTLIGEDNKDE